MFTPIYRIGFKTWQHRLIFDNPRFVGGDNPREFDFHLCVPDPPPETATPGAVYDPGSPCLDKGELPLSPGVTKANSMKIDVGYIDMGFHYHYDMEIHDYRLSNNSIPPDTIVWENPTHYSNGSLCDDLSGNIVYFGISEEDKNEKEVNLKDDVVTDIFPLYDKSDKEKKEIEELLDTKDSDRIKIMETRYIDLCESYYFGKMPEGCNYIGVQVYNDSGIKSDIEWLEYKY